MNIGNLESPAKKVDIVIDSDAYNEVDDQFAIAYALRSKENISVKAIYAAPFSNSHAKTPEEGMEQSYNEILTLLALLGENTEVFRGSKKYLPDEKTPVISEAAEDLIRRAKEYSPDDPLYVVAIGAITNVASALLMDPTIANNIVVVWLGGHAHHFFHNKEFNLKQDVAAARVVMQSAAPFVQLPCKGVVDMFTISRLELEHFFKGKNALCDHLADHAIEHITKERKSDVWTKVIWDVVAVAWLMNDGDRFMFSRIIDVKLPEYGGFYTDEVVDKKMRYVFSVRRDEIFNDLIEKITK